jgi:ubiquinone biosynthesis protein UbiJ
MANQELRNFREDVSFLTRETERLNEELRMLSSRKL